MKMGQISLEVFANIWSGNMLVSVLFLGRLNDAIAKYKTLSSKYKLCQ